VLQSASGWTAVLFAVLLTSCLGETLLQSSSSVCCVLCAVLVPSADALQPRSVKWMTTAAALGPCSGS
jgi:hypothetical protein